MLCDHSGEACPIKNKNAHHITLSNLSLVLISVIFSRNMVLILDSFVQLKLFAYKVKFRIAGIATPEISFTANQFYRRSVLVAYILEPFMLRVLLCSNTLGGKQQKKLLVDTRFVVSANP